MAQADDSNKVLIVGAGPGGLVLAQILRRHIIPFEIFERDVERNTRSQGWAVALVELVALFFLPDRQQSLTRCSPDAYPGSSSSSQKISATCSQSASTTASRTATRCP